MATNPFPLVIPCTPEVLGRYNECMVCGGSKKEILAAFDAFLCASNNREACSASTLLPLIRPFMGLGERELIAATTYIWMLFLEAEDPEIDTSQAGMSQAIGPFLMRSQTELLAMQLSLLCGFGFTPLPLCSATELFNMGRCFCVSWKELLAMRLYLVSQFVGFFVQLNMDPAYIQKVIAENVGFVSANSMEAATVWLMCQLYDVAIQNQMPT